MCPTSISSRLMVLLLVQIACNEKHPLLRHGLN
uniref:Uncharacterized protein n=1 Tax=Rhizophora mucronata TaxID=61149 RepID=A0A2P2NDR1_RHIMU